MEANGPTKTIVMARDFSKFPAGRFRKDGDASATAFRDDLLADALNNGEDVEVVFDGVPVFAASFLEEAFGGLVREHHMTKAFLDERLRLRADDPVLADFVSLAERYIERADQAAAGWPRIGSCGKGPPGPHCSKGAGDQLGRGRS